MKHPIVVTLWKIGPSYRPEPPTSFEIDLSSYTRMRDTEYVYPSLHEAQMAYAAMMRKEFTQRTKELMNTKADVIKREKDLEAIRIAMIEAERIVNDHH